MRLLAVLAALLLVGCTARHPLGIEETEWNRMTPGQQLAARERQAELDRAAAERRAREAEHRARAEEARRRQLAERRANARYGDIVQCIIEDGIAKLGSTLRDVESAAFSRVRGAGEELSLRSKDGKRHGRLWAEFQEDGMTVRLCSGGRGDRDCATLLGTTRDLRDGIERRLIIDSRLNIRLRCALAPGAVFLPPR